jgi:hypothetical protein
MTMDKRSFKKRLEHLEYKSGGYAIGVQRLDKGQRLVWVCGTNEAVEEERFRARYPNHMLIRLVRKPMNFGLKREEDRHGDDD